MPVENWPAYQLGLINKQGQIIKKPNTILERASLTPMDVYVLKLKTIMGPEAKLLNNTIYLKETNLDGFGYDSKTFAERFEKELQIKEDIQKIVNQLIERTAQASGDGFTSIQIEQFIVESFLQKI